MYDHIQNVALLVAIGLVVGGAWLRYGLPDALMIAGLLLIALIIIGRAVR